MYVHRSAIEGVTLGLPRHLGTPALPDLGTFARVQHEAQKVVSDGRAALRWGVAGSLTSTDVKIEHPGPEIANRFRKVPLKGFGKSNIFALDIAWRSGFHVPLLNVGTMDREEFIYPLANMLATYAEAAIRAKNVLLEGLLLSCAKQITWSGAATVLDPAANNNRIKKGDRMFVLAGWRRNGVGHVGIISHIHSQKNDTSGATVGASDIVFDGWEATTVGAKRVIRSHWSTADCKKVEEKCPATLTSRSLSNFCNIHILSLRPQLIPCHRGVLVAKTNVCSML